MLYNGIEENICKIMFIIMKGCVWFYTKIVHRDIVFNFILLTFRVHWYIATLA